MAATEDTPLVESDTNGKKGDGCLYVFFHGLRVVAIIVCITQIVSQFLTIMILNEDGFQDVLRVYVVVFCIGFILAELDLYRENLPFLVSWAHRGFFYTFIGVIGVEEAKTVRISQNAKTHRVKISLSGRLGGLIVMISSLSIFVLGILYILMAAMCLRKIHDRVMGLTKKDDEVTTELIV